MNSPQIIKTPPPPPTPQRPVTLTSGETVTGMLSYFQRTKSLGRKDPYIILATQQNLLMLHITKELVKRNVEEAQGDAKDTGKGFFGQWGAQLSSSFNFAGKYRGWDKEQVLAEIPEAVVIPVSSVSKVEVKYHEATSDYGVITRKYKLRIHRPGEKYNFESDILEKELSVFKTLFPGKIKSDVKL